MTVNQNVLFESHSPDVEWCHTIIEDVSRTFAISIDTLNEPLSTYICLGYLLCRIPDTIEDSPKLSSETKVSLLSQYRTALKTGDEDEIETFISESMAEKPSDPLEPKHWQLVEQTDRVMDVYQECPDDVQQQIESAVDELTYGMRKYCGRDMTRPEVRIQTLPDLRQYCYFVAGTVSHLISGVVDAAEDVSAPTELKSYGEKYGLLLQLVNITKDVHEDYHAEGNIYIPASLLEQYGVPQDELLEERHWSETGKAVTDIIKEAQTYVPEARNYLLSMPRRDEDIYTAWAIPYLLAVATLREIKENTITALKEGGVKIDREEVYAILETVPETDPTELEQLEKAISRQPFDTVSW